MAAVNENEEFEFRLRVEKESAAPARLAKPAYDPNFQPKRPLTWNEKRVQTGEAFDRTAGTGLRGAARTGVAAVEDVLQMASGVAGDVAGAATSLVTQNPARGESARRAITTEPATETGKAGARYLGALAEPVGRLFSTPVEALEKRGHPVAAQTLRAIEDVAPLKLPKALRGAGGMARETVRPLAERVAQAGEARTVVRAAEEVPLQSKIAQARSIGLKLAPSEAGGPTGKVLEGMGGKIQTEMSLSRANSKVINRTAGREIGLSDTQPLTQANIGRAKQKAFAVYDRVRKAGRIEADTTYRDELSRVRERTAQEALDFPDDTNEAIDKEIQKFNVSSADSASMLEKVKSLRERAGRNMQAPDADKFELGLAQKKIATAMENLIERHVSTSSPPLISDFRAARQQLAKIYNVEDALSPNGNVSAAVLARQLKRGVPLSGNLKALAETYMEFPKVMRSVDAMGGHAAFSALDYLVGGVEAVAHPAGAAKIAGALAARPLARGIIKSEAYQRAAIKPRDVKPSLVTRGARAIAGPTLQDLPP